ncbi:hypothetical protein R3X26_03455 [Vibrio sp. TH_r3]|uniref:hypothetical protein n=1 Tax=Vibrio sp. TH_r3 TaxID=3082084 RepID=UPI002954AFE5|nr:hypothetical protein [Vibrio sp. TH_r3]MDV7103459.1 hypothetical protein [Vibrio sp. TH_r3]
MSELTQLINKKQQWLLSQVDVTFPTPESILGRDLYVKHDNTIRYKPLDLDDRLDSSLLDALYLVDFHRLTVMFSQLQALRWENQREQEYVLEFFAQIILSDQHDLYVGFKNNKAIISAIVTKEPLGHVLISDVASLTSQSCLTNLFYSKVIEQYNKQDSVIKIIYVPV